jgi:hypothetical protein
MVSLHLFSFMMYIMIEANGLELIPLNKLLETTAVRFHYTDISITSPVVHPMLCSCDIERSTQGNVPDPVLRNYSPRSSTKNNARRQSPPTIPTSRLTSHQYFFTSWCFVRQQPHRCNVLHSVVRDLIARRKVCRGLRL